MSSPVVIRPRLGALIYLGVAAMCVAAIAPLLVSGQWHTLAAVAPIPIALLGGGYVALLAPSVVFDDRAVHLRNPLRTISVPFERIESWETHRGFTVRTSEGSFSAWAAPPPDRLGAERLGPGDAGMRDPRLRRDSRGDVRTSAAPGSPSGDAALTLEDRLRSSRGAERSSGGSGTDPVTRTWNAVHVAVLAASLFGAAALWIASNR